MKAFWQDFGDEVLSLDRGMPWTFVRLCLAPGALIRRYVELRDGRVVRPLRYFLIGFALAALAFQGFGGADVAHESFMQGAAARRGGEDAATALWALLSQIEWLFLLVLLPAMAGSLCLCFRRHRPGFAEMWVLCLYLIGHVLALEALALVLDEWTPLPGVSMVALLLPPAWLLATCLGYFPGTVLSRIGRSLAAGFVSLLLTLMALLAMMFAIGLVRSLVANG